MIVDAHQHFWQYGKDKHAWITAEMSAIRRDFLPEDLEPIYKANKVDGCVLVQVDQNEEENIFLLKCAEKNKFIKGIVGWVDLRSPGIQKQLEFHSAHKPIKGFRHIAQAEPNGFLLGDDFCNGISFLHPYGFTYDILVMAHQLEQVEPFVRKFPNQPFIIDHLAKPAIRDKNIESWKTHMTAIARHEQVYCKLSGMVTEANWATWTYDDLLPYMNVVLEAFGPSRLVYGSDWPVCLVASSYEKQFGVIQKFISSLSTDEQKKILGENAIRFYHL